MGTLLVILLCLLLLVVDIWAVSAYTKPIVRITWYTWSIDELGDCGVSKVLVDTTNRLQVYHSNRVDHYYRLFTNYGIRIELWTL